MNSLIIALATTASLVPAASAGLTTPVNNEKVLEVKSVFNRPLKKSIAQMQKEGVMLIAQSKYEGEDPHGNDPHGRDPHSERHDSKLPANKDRDKYSAPQDAYGDQYNNSQQPY